MEIKDNELLRQFEIITETGLIAIEYSIMVRRCHWRIILQSHNA